MRKVQCAWFTVAGRDVIRTCAVANVLLIVCVGCATMPIAPIAQPHAPVLPALRGSYYQVRPGETLWRIAHAYGLQVETLASVNRLGQTSALRPGQRLFLPLPEESRRFLWPARGRLRPPSSSTGIEIAAPAGSVVRASRSGRVAVATRRLAGWGATIVIDHLDGYLTIYTGLGSFLVSPGASLRQGTPIATLGAETLHFEIREGITPRNTLAMLPAE